MQHVRFLQLRADLPQLQLVFDKPSPIPEFATALEAHHKELNKRVFMGCFIFLRPFVSVSLTQENAAVESDFRRFMADSRVLYDTAKQTLKTQLREHKSHIQVEKKKRQPAALPPTICVVFCFSFGLFRDPR